MPCSPEELKRLAELMADEKVGESSVRNLLDEAELGITNGAAASVRSKMGWLGPIRIQRAVFGDEFAAKALNKVQLALQQASNLEAKYYRAYNDGVAEAYGHNPIRKIFGVSHEQDTLIAKALEQTNSRGEFVGPRASLPDEAIKAAGAIRRNYEELWKFGVEHGMDPDTYIGTAAKGGVGYRRLIADKPAGAFWDPNPSPVVEAFRERLDPAGIRFAAELERRGTLRNPDPTASAGFKDYVHGMSRAKILAPAIDAIEKEFVDSYFGKQIVRQGGRYLTYVNDKPAYEAWLGLRDHILGVPTNLDRQLTMTMKSMGEKFGLPGLDTRNLYGISQAYTNLFYGGVLGSPLGTRPASLVRHAARLINSYSEFGMKDFMSGLQVALTPGSWETAIKRGVVTAPLEGLHDQINLASGAGRAISGISSNFLKVFDASDRLYRVATAAMADTRFNRALEENSLERLKGGREIRDHVVSLVKQGQIERARDEYATHIVSNTEYAYGKGNRPQLFRGALGSAAGMLMAYPINLGEMYVRLGKRALQGIQEKSLDEAMPLIRQVGITTAMMYAGSQFLNADLKSVFLHGALPESFPGMMTPIHAYQAGRSSVFWGAGNLFMTGETDFDRRKRSEYYKEFGRDMSNMIPGGLFAREVTQLIDEPTLQNLGRHMGFAPLADEANERARERARQTRLATPKVRGIKED